VLASSRDAAKSSYSEVDRQVKVHVAASHPHTPFPLARVMSAAAAVDQGDYGEGEGVLTVLGDSYLYR
jgi:hypothetical protein